MNESLSGREKPFGVVLRTYIDRVKNKTSAPIGAWEVKLEIMTDRPTDQPTDAHNGS